jgi:dTDP-4-amino-4,6-dideoxygalactose transaminase
VKIPITKPYIDDAEKEAVSAVLESGWLAQGPNVAEFEKLFKEFTGASFAFAATSCTTALHLALEALGIGRGDKVIVPSFTYVASANAVEYTGAEPIFCDIDLKTFNIDLAKVEEILKSDKGGTIKAIMPVHLFGLCADMPWVMKLAEKYDLKVIEDAACGFDASIDGKHSGTFGDAGCFSFHPRKSLTTGEGGMLVTADEELASKVASLRDHGAGKTDLQRHKEKGGSLLPDFKVRGYNYRMTDMQGAIGVCQMKKARFIMERRRSLARKYDAALEGITELRSPITPEGYTHGYQSYICLFTGGEDMESLTIDKVDALNARRNAFMDRLEEKGIATRQGTHAVHTLGFYKDKYGLSDGDFINSYAADRLTIALPLYAAMTEEEFEYVVGTIKETFVQKQHSDGV